MSTDPFNKELTLKQLGLETEHLSMTYRSLEDRFKSLQDSLQGESIRESGKLAELDFISRYLETILDHISQGILFIDINGIVTTYNVAAQKILQVPPQQLLMHHFCDCFDDLFLGFSIKDSLMQKQCPKTSLLILKHNDQTLEIDIETTFVMMNPQTYPLDLRHPSVPFIAQNIKDNDLLKMPQAPIQGLLILLRDVTKIKKLQQIANRNDRLKELGSLAAHVAHEIRNPLGGIKGFASLLFDELKDRPELQKMASYIVEGTDHLNQFVTEVLNYTRPSPLHIESVDLTKLIEELKHLMQVDANWNDKIDFKIFSDESPSCVQIDPLLFKSSLLNLFVNAAQAMPSGGVLSVKIKNEAPFTTLQIKDTGNGISPENISKLFTPFFTTKKTGNGLGLAEVHKAIQAHQGTIEVNSILGEGTEFTIKIPSHFTE